MVGTLSLRPWNEVVEEYNKRAAACGQLPISESAARAAASDALNKLKRRLTKARYTMDTFR